jgi:hypothetical protein
MVFGEKLEQIRNSKLCNCFLIKLGNFLVDTDDFNQEKSYKFDMANHDFFEEMKLMNLIEFV